MSKTEIENKKNNDNENDNIIDYDIVKLNSIKESIQNMAKFNQIEILRILHSHKEVTIN